MRVVITSNCMTGGLTSAFSMLFPTARVVPLPYVGVDEGVLIDQLSNADAWLVSSPADVQTAALERVKNVQLKVINFPELYFNAFHPDQVYAWMRDGSLVEGATGPYNSAIALWAWQHGLNAQQTISLFTPEIFGALGYHDRWQVSIDRLRHDFVPFPHLDYRDFIIPLQRAGNFMHTVNHPKVAAITQMARILAKQIDPTVDAESVPVENMMVDGLFMASFSWSVYPSVANALGLKGAFMWKLEDHSVIGLEEFVQRSFAKYEVQQPHNVDCHELLWPIYDEVLLPIANGGKL
jgi:hypothetical protein